MSFPRYEGSVLIEVVKGIPSTMIFCCCCFFFFFCSDPISSLFEGAITGYQVIITVKLDKQVESVCFLQEIH